MSAWTPPPTLTADRIGALAALLRELADNLEAPHARGILANLALGADDAWPADVMAGHVAGGDVTSRTETSALRERADQATHECRRALVDLDQLPRTLRRILAAYGSWDPRRAVALCPNCHHPLDRSFARCQFKDPVTGAQCGGREGGERRCKTCDEPQPGGKWLRNGECGACAQHRRRTGRARVAVSMLALGEGLLQAGEAYAA